MTLATVVSPVSQSVLTVSTLYPISIYSTEDSAVDVYHNNVLLGSASNVGGGFFSYNWTPVATESDAQINVVGNHTGASPYIHYTVDDPNLISQDLTTWTKSNAGITITGSQTDPWGGNTAYKVSLPATSSTFRSIQYTATSTPTEILCGIDVWVKPYGPMSILYAASSGSAKGNFIDISTGQSKSTALYGTIIEYGPNNDGWVRVRFARAAESYSTNVFPFYFCRVMDSISMTITPAEAAAGIGLYFCQPRFIGSVIPYLTYEQKLCVRYYETIGLMEHWYYKHPAVDSPIDMVGIGDSPIYHGSYSFRVMRPTTWSTNKKYRVLYVLPALVDDIENALGDDNAWQAIGAYNYADIYDIVIVVPYFRTTAWWFGSNVDGSVDQHNQMVGVPPAFAKKWLSASDRPEDHMLLGYSKSGWGAYNLVMMNPSVFGYACAWDSPWKNYYPKGDTVLAFDTQDQYNLYSPQLIAPTYANQFNTGRRFVIMGGNAFSSDYTYMINTFINNGISYAERYETEAIHRWGTNTWLPHAVELIMQISNTNSADDEVTNGLYFGS